MAWLAIGCSPPAELVPPPVPRDRVPDDLPPNFVVVIVDDVGIDKVERYGVHPDTAPTPTLDRLADEGIRFENAFAMPTCTATRAALLTGRHAHRTGTGGIIWPFDTTYELPLEEVTLPELLARADPPYDSALAGKWHLSSIVSPSATLLPTLQGFGWFSGSMNNLWVDSQNESGGYGFWEFEKVQPNGVIAIEQQYATTDTTDDAIGQLAMLREPFLLVVSYNGAHNPWHRPPAELHSYPEGLSRVEQHLAATEAVDTELGRLVDAIDDELRSRTYLVVVGDNGTPAPVTTEPSRRNRAKGTVFEGGVRVPMVVTGPDVPEGIVSDAMISVVDLWPTLADLASVNDRSAAGPVDGVSQAAVWRDEADAVRELVYLEHVTPTGRGPHNVHDRAMRDPDYKLVRDLAGVERFYALQPGLDDGDDLLAEGEPLDPEAQAALIRLREAFASQSL